MCCGCCGYSECGRCIADIFYIFEKISSICAFTAVVCCVMITITFVLLVGIGLGYNYCVVEARAQKTGGIEPDATTSIPDTTGPGYRRFQEMVHKSTVPMPSIRPTMVIPLHEEVDLKTLFSKLRGRNHNVTLQLII